MTPQWPEAIYQKTFNSDWDENPYIECLPSLMSLDDFLRSVASFPAYSLDERALPAHFRRHLIARLSNLLIPTTEMVSAHQRLEVALRQGYIARNPRNPSYVRAMYGSPKGERTRLNSSASCFLITGLSGTGKTTILETVLGRYPQVIMHRGIAPGIGVQHQVVWLKVDCPHDASLKGLCLAISRALDNLLGTTYHDEWSTSRASIDDLQDHVTTLVRNLSVGVLVLDELQHLSSAKVGGDKKFLHFLVNLINEAGVPIVFAGTYILKSILSQQMPNARRVTGSGTITVARLKRSDPLWSAFVQTMWAFQWVANPAPLTSVIEDALYECTQGLRDGVVKLFMSAQNLALDSGSETVDEKTLRQAYDVYFTPMHKVISLLHDGVDDWDPRFDDLLRNAWSIAAKHTPSRDVASHGADDETRSNDEQNKRAMDPAKCDRAASLPPTPQTHEPECTDLRDVSGDAYEEIAAKGLIARAGDPSSILRLVK
jgi:hypothetical protein